MNFSLPWGFLSGWYFRASFLHDSLQVTSLHLSGLCRANPEEQQFVLHSKVNRVLDNAMMDPKQAQETQETRTAQAAARLILILKWVLCLAPGEDVL